MSQTTISNASFVDDDDEDEEEDDEFDEEGEEDSQDEKPIPKPTATNQVIPSPPSASSASVDKKKDGNRGSPASSSSSSASLLQVRRETLFDEKGDPLWNKLPVALLSHIFSMLSTPLQLVNTMVVCKSWCLAYSSAPKNNNISPSFPSVSSSSSPNPSSSFSSSSSASATTTRRRQKLTTEEEEELWHRLHRNHFGGSKFNSEEKKRFDTLAGLEGVVDTDGSPLQKARNWKEQFKQDVLILAQLRALEQALLWATNFGYHLVVKRLLYQHHVKLLVDPRDEEEHEQQQGATSEGSKMAEADERRHQKEEEDLETNTTNTPSDLTDLGLLDLSKGRGGGGEGLGGTRKGPYLIAQSLIDLEYRSPTKGGEGDASPTPLLLAVMKGYVEIAQMLLAFGAEADARLLDGSEKTALHIAVGFKSHSATNYGITTNATTTPPPQSIEEKEIEESRMDLLRLLLARRADTELRAKHGLTPLIIAASVDNLPAVHLLLENDADVDARTDETELTGLHIAVQNGNLEMVNALLAAGALVDARSNRLNTPLHLAAAGTNPEVVRALLLTGSAKVNAVNKKLWTPLHFAACENSIECARVLLEYGANPRAETKYRLTPIDFAYERQHKLLLKLLKKHEKCILM
jgi:ankyrin repeat protein